MNKMTPKPRPISLKIAGESILHWLEIFLGLIVILAVIIVSWNQIQYLFVADWSDMATFIELLKTILQLAIGVEVARLLFSYSLETIIELAVFVVARKMLLLEGDFLSLLMGVAALVLLFGARHFFIEDDKICEKLRKDTEKEA